MMLKVILRTEVKITKLPINSGGQPARPSTTNTPSDESDLTHAMRPPPSRTPVEVSLPAHVPNRKRSVGSQCDWFLLRSLSCCLSGYKVVPTILPMHEAACPAMQGLKWQDGLSNPLIPPWHW